ncbi:3D-(3,5/4)-trihydroxycyclohexane-1,2-dione acylhydrolase (decyclizing) (plasmid) [Rhizobium sp. CB3171]|uniref:3D-(3,5/4)-trihydroxycyclohexane-1,2-dione acylhydrolase (decyclizing) n=1 Tax=unclassified Rhizobium TaxID=2613769 RepID=UPI000CDF4796|nr:MULTISPECIES: 3D-(3,5/4)-trihydroxycyclohexane-1,2-dione acylhydrolase (decyclizing) [Rhizobium]AVA26566.1 3,5/4-trihydroxycyclohexane-1,2-dione hydrolase 3 [Rhizobium sp. NXC24]UWU24189.1 3D-(3,5/4)-trihydroxycyclohexane-1,2-dione acylhydrolase (decyclizing) [Rhizobium tropici]WFU05118.1 3D-(3,5/4)-trihydroxycyclohexane-1,2-dione acylhydrolase (decyclizing) [Rhizobium sp. CB3171]
MSTVRLTLAQAIVRFLIAQRIEDEGDVLPLFAGVHAIFGHGNVTCLGSALEEVQNELPTYRGQNEQSMALAAVAYARARRRKQIHVCSASVGPGSSNMVTAAGVAMSDRLPVLFLCGDNFASRLPDPVLQQVEHFHDMSLTTNDAFKAVSSFFDRITRPEQILNSLPQAVALMLDPAACGPATISLAQDVQGEAFDYPESFFAERVHKIPRYPAADHQIDAAVRLIKEAKRPLIIAGGGVHYSGATDELADFSDRFGIPVAETIMGRSALLHNHRLNIASIGVMGGNAGNNIGQKADLVIAIGTRLADMITGSWSVFRDPDVKFLSLNANRFDANKHMAQPVVGDAKLSLEAITAKLGDWLAPAAWADEAVREKEAWDAIVEQRTGRTNQDVPNYPQVIGAVQRNAKPDDVIVSAAGGLPGELYCTWKSIGVGTFESEYGFSCMGYEIAGAYGQKIANPEREIIAMLGDGSYMMLNSDIYSSVLTGNKIICIVCDNGGFAVINRLQTGKGGAEFNNLLASSKHAGEVPRIDFAMHARSMGAESENVTTIEELEAAIGRARQSDRTYVIALRTHPYEWMDGGSWWDVGMPEVTNRHSIATARDAQEAQRKHQRKGV